MPVVYEEERDNVSESEYFSLQDISLIYFGQGDG